jgi:5-deoxy-glucuronate isomerase
LRTLVSPGEETEHITVALADLAGGEELSVDEAGQEVAVVILSGTVSATADGKDLGPVGGRSSVFEGPGDAVYAPAGVSLTLQASGEAHLAVIMAAAGEDPAGEARVIRPEDQRIQDVGQGNWSRTVRTMLGPEHQASRLLLGETINPPGNWSSYPPHRHDRQQPPDEVALEEVYLFKVDPPTGFGVQIMYDEAGQERAFVVRDDDVAAIRSGYHPVVAASGYTLYYLWVLAGAGREMIPHLDPDHAWVQQANGG